MLVTPFDGEGNVMIDAMRDNIRFLLEKTKGFSDCTITPLGSNGELAHLSTEDAKKVMKMSAEEIGGKATLIMGTGRASTHETLELSKYAESVGSDGVQVVIPYYFVPTEEGIYLHYKKLCDSLNIGVVVYNNPAFSGAWINPQLMKKMVTEFGEEGKIASIKENTPHLMLFDKMVKAMRPHDIGIYSGFGEQWYAYQYPWGADGLATPFGNFFPEYPMEMFKAGQRDDRETMKNWLEKMQPYYSFVGRCSANRKDVGIAAKPGGAIYGEGNVRFGVIKEAMNIMGLNGGNMRLPLTMLNEAERSELKEILKDLGLI